jgi:lipoyl(octanoyl) transferase
MTIEWKTSTSPIEYQYAVNEMEKRVKQIQNGDAEELVWFLEHPSIYTAGTSAKDTDLINQNFPVFNTGRGGQYTYHGPGQRIVYLMLDLKKRGEDLRKYIANLEDWIIAVLSEIGIHAEKRAGRIGIWTINKQGKEAKIAAIGVRVQKWISYHGIAINVSPNLNHYDGIIPCGISEFGVTSLQELGYDISYEKLDSILRNKFKEFL